MSCEEQRSSSGRGEKLMFAVQNQVFPRSLAVYSSSFRARREQSSSPVADEDGPLPRHAVARRCAYSFHQLAAAAAVTAAVIAGPPSPRSHSAAQHSMRCDNKRKQWTCNRQHVAGE